MKSKEFEDILAIEGIKHEIRAADTPEHMGVAERAMRTVFTMVSTMLIASKQPKTYWLEAARTALHVLDRVATPGIPKGKTPYEMWFKVKPDVSHLRVWGCTAYAWIDDMDRKELDDKALECILFGYEGGGYRLLHLKTDKIIVRNHVIFDERPLPGEGPTSDVNKTPNRLEEQSEEEPKTESDTDSASASDTESTSETDSSSTSDTDTGPAQQQQQQQPRLSPSHSPPPKQPRL
mmetsp:Transcript_22144/g.28655  ORF Transcript_22144/g.28655 Transcript_22144/m.28655 type:complete len:235 (+) Transcript_22144:729-1433(+)